jgi:hypothetical protein
MCTYNSSLNKFEEIIWLYPIARPSNNPVRLPAMGILKRYSKTLEYEYRVKTAAVDTLKRYFILSLTLYLEWYNAYSILYSGGPH